MDRMARTGQSRGHRNESYLLFGTVAALAVGIRVAYLLIAAESDLFPGVFLDSRYYADFARRIALGEGTGSAPYLMSPLYPYVLSLFTGADGHLAVWGVRAVQMAAGCAVALLVTSIARRCGGRAAAWIAGVACAVYGPLIHYEAMLLAEALQGFCLVAALWSVVVLLPRTSPGKSRLLAGLASGAMLGLASGLRPTALVLLAVTILVLLLSEWRRKAPLAPVIATCLAMTAGAAICIVPFTIRNLEASRETILLSANGGFNFWVGNHAGSDGVFTTPPGYDFEHDPVGLDLARKGAGRPLSYGEASSWWTGRAMGDIASEPGRWAGLLVKKLRLFFAPGEIPQLGEDFSWYRERAWPLGVPITATMALVLALLAPLLVRVLKGPPDQTMLLPYAWLAAYVLTIALFFIAGRYRAPIMPIAFIPAGTVLAMLIERLGRGNGRGRAAAAIAIVVVAVILLSGRIDSTAQQPAGVSPTGLIERQSGLLLYGKGDFAGAEQWYRKSLAIREDPITRSNLGNALKAQGKIDEAESEYRRALGMDSTAAVTWYNLGNLYRDHRGDRPGAIGCYLKAIEAQPQFPNPYLTLALLYSYDGKMDRALAVIDQGLLRIQPTETGIRGTLTTLKEQLSASRKGAGR
jgi:4-amino-4-deoxy-L-arabinose transferase-like glycosyltransferase